MNKHAIEHFHESKYCFYLDEKKCLIRVRTARNDTIKKVEVIWNEWCKFYKEQIVTELHIAYNDDLYSYYETVIESEQASYEYVIRITDGDGKLYYLADGRLTDKFEQASTFLNEYMSKFPNKVDLITRNNKLSGRLFYQIFPERFCCSDFSKKYISMKWDEEKKIDNNHFLGGDLKGISSKIPYLKEMGVGGIYLNPIHPSPSAHKYDVDDYFGIDPMFGSLDDFKELLRVAHENDIVIVMDMVFNHCSYTNNLFQDVVKNRRKSKYYNWFFVDGDKPVFKKINYLTFGHVPYMPKLNTNNPEVIEYFKKVVLYWADLGVDGFRLDVAFEVSYHFWRELKNALLEKYPEQFFIGEDWLNSEKRLDKSQWDSIMNYPFRFALMQYFEDDNYDSKWIADRLSGVFVRYPNPINYALLNLIDSHDTERWIETVKHDRNKYLLSYALLMFYPGVPEVYYGDEIFMDGKQDPFNRKGMKWNSEEFNSPDHKLFLEILKLYQNDAIKYGTVKFFENNGVAFIEREYKGETYLLAFYKGDKEVEYNAKNIVLSLNFEGNKFAKTGFVVSKN